MRFLLTTDCYQDGGMHGLAAGLATCILSGRRGLLVQPRRTFLIFRPGSEDWGAFAMVEEAEQVPDGWELVTSEPLPLSLDHKRLTYRLRGVRPADPFYIGRLPILAHGDGWARKSAIIGGAR